MKRGDQITISDYKGVRVVTVVGFQSSTGDLLIDDGTDDLDTPRFCDFDDIVDTLMEGETDG